jgi:hypothetical protein
LAVTRRRHKGLIGLYGISGALLTSYALPIWHNAIVKVPILEKRIERLEKANGKEPLNTKDQHAPRERERPDRSDR